MCWPQWSHQEELETCSEPLTRPGRTLRRVLSTNLLMALLRHRHGEPGEQCISDTKLVRGHKETWLWEFSGSGRGMMWKSSEDHHAPQTRDTLLVRQVGFHVDQDDLTTLTPEHRGACLLILQKPIGGCNVEDHIDFHVPACEAGRPSRQHSGYLCYWGFYPHSLCP